MQHYKRNVSLYIPVHTLGTDIGITVQVIWLQVVARITTDLLFLHVWSIPAHLLHICPDILLSLCVRRTSDHVAGDHNFPPPWRKVFLWSLTILWEYLCLLRKTYSKDLPLTHCRCCDIDKHNHRGKGSAMSISWLVFVFECIYFLDSDIAE